jgi:drug/metabolite transporter (DMT)-like permease
VRSSAPATCAATILALAAGLLYTGYLIIVERARGRLKPLPLLFLATLFGAAFLLPLSLVLGEQIIPHDWMPLFALAIASQVVGQGLLVYALGHVPPLVVGLALLTQPAISAFIGWAVYGETLTPLDWSGAVGIAIALVLVRLRDRKQKAISQP